jgi:RNA polymerase sigma factor (sigma-70 family)
LFLWEGTFAVQGAGVLKRIPVNPHQTDDEQILRRIASGDRNALAELHERYQRSLFRYLCQMTPDRGLAEEILQDTLVAAWRSAANYEGRASVHAWLLGIARRQAHNSLRRRGLPTADAEALDGLVDTDPAPDERLVARAGREDLARAIAELAPAHREILALNFAHGLSYAEIARVLSVPEGTVKSRLNGAKRALRSAVSQRGEEQPS